MRLMVWLWLGAMRIIGMIGRKLTDQHKARIARRSLQRPVVREQQTFDGAALLLPRPLAHCFARIESFSDEQHRRQHGAEDGDEQRRAPAHGLQRQNEKQGEQDRVKNAKGGLQRFCRVRQLFHKMSVAKSDPFIL